MSQCSRSPVGQQLCQIIHEEPGIHFRALERAANLQSTGQLRHHIDQLQRAGTIVEVSDGGFHRFFIATDHDRRLRQRMVRFARPMAYRLARVLLRQDATRTEIRRALGCADSTLGYYLTRMEQAGDIVRRAGPQGQVFALVDPEGVREVLEARWGPKRQPLQESSARPPRPTARKASKEHAPIPATQAPTPRHAHAPAKSAPSPAPDQPVPTKAHDEHPLPMLSR